VNFEIASETFSVLNIQHAILLYGNPGTQDVQYASVHPVRCGEGGIPVIQEGRPLDRSQFDQACAGLRAATRVDAGIFPDTVLSAGISHIIWWQRPGRHTYFFNCAPAPEGIQCVGRRAGVALTPGAVFVAKADKLWVYAVKGTARPTEKAKLFHMPVMNVWKNGAVCTGSVPLPGSSLAKSIDAWEGAFWGSHFTHPNHEQPVRYEGGIHAFCTDLLDGKFMAFPERVLVGIPKMTIGSLVALFDAGKQP
jgi:PRTRC genetic system protein B